MNGDREHPSRQTEPARSAVRRTWYGYGTLSRAEKSGFGRFLHDCSYVFADVSIPALPVLFAIAGTADESGFGAATAGLVAWTTTVVVGTAIRGGWIQPLATDTLGWVSRTPSLIALRLVYFNAALIVGVFGGVLLASATGVGPLSIVVAFVVALVSTMAFPGLAERTYDRVRTRTP